ncbi:ABC transporter ATP-binding protein [Burkholderia gladioli]|nr:ABC transporter ATP-binding protein [Burkholderia gladioli]
MISEGARSMSTTRYFKRNFWSLLVTMLLSCTKAAFTVGLLAYINYVATQGLYKSPLDTLLTGLGLLGALLLSDGVSQYVQAGLGSSLVAQLRRDLSSRFIEIEYHLLAGKKASVFGALIEDIGRISPAIVIMPHLFYNGIFVIICATYVAMLSTKLFLVLIGGLGIASLVSFLLVRSTGRRFDEMRVSEEALFEHFRTIADGKKEMLLNRSRAEHFADTILQPAIERAQKVSKQTYLNWNLNQAWMPTAIYGTIFMVVYFGYMSFSLPAELIIRFVIGSLFIIGPLNFLIESGRQVGTGLSSWRHLERVGLDLRDGPQTPMLEHASQPLAQWRTIQASELAYRYPESPAESRGIGPLNFRIDRGEMIFIIGGNGSGKSTMMHMLCGLLPAGSGRLYLDGQPVDPESRGYREKFSSVFGDFYLFDHVIDQQGALLPDARTRGYLRDLGLDKQVFVEDGRLSQTNLSTGQRKRLALLQCYAENREICLFDEWAADQDPHFREHFYLELLPNLRRQGKTLIVVSHDDRYFHVADRLIKLERGRIAFDKAPEPNPAAGSRSGEPDASRSGLPSEADKVVG